jgi:hypothetical protein
MPGGIGDYSPKVPVMRLLFRFKRITWKEKKRTTHNDQGGGKPSFIGQGGLTKLTIN